MAARSRVWKVGVLKKTQCTPTLPLGHREAKEDIVRQLVQLHTLKSQAMQRLNQQARGSRADGELAETDLARIKKEASDDLDDAVREMKELRKEMRRRWMHF